MIRVVADDAIPYIRGVLEPYCHVTYLDGRKISAADIRNADVVLVRTRTRCDRSLLEGSSVGLIATATIGYDHIDMEFCSSNGIRVETATGCNARGVLQWIGATLGYLSDFHGWDPRSKTIGVVGTGNVGSLVAEYCRLWGFGVLCCDPPLKETGKETYRDYVDLEQIASRCDIITFHTPLTRSGSHPTLHMADGAFFDRLRPGTTVVNSSRGEVIDSGALLKAIYNGTCNACIDTWENEPTIDLRLLENTIIATPHIAGYTAQGKANASSMIVRAVARHYGLLLEEWYPFNDVPRTAPYPIGWEKMKETVPFYLDIMRQTYALMEFPEAFETMRRSYAYRQEYF